VTKAIGERKSPQMRVASDMPCRHERKTTPCEG